MIVLDTDHISFLQRPESEEGQRLLKRLDASQDLVIATAVITVEEQMRGWLQVIARYRDPQQQAPYYDKLIAFIRFFAEWQIVPFDAPAIQMHRILHESRVRIASTDLKIAAICLANQAILLSRNFKDFRQVPGLQTEDWTAS